MYSMYGDVRKLRGLMHVATLIMQVHDFGHDQLRQVNWADILNLSDLVLSHSYCSNNQLLNTTKIKMTDGNYNQTIYELSVTECVL